MSEATLSDPAVARPAVLVPQRDQLSGPRRRTRVFPRLGMGGSTAIVVGAGLVGIWVLVAILAPVLAPYSPTSITAGPQLAAPSAAHWFGTDALGRDVLSRVMYGGRITLSTGFVAVSISGVVGVALGAVAGFYGGWRSVVIMRVIDVLFAFPELVLAMGLAAALGAGLSSLIIAVSVVGIPAFARITYSLTISLREREFVDAARVAGTGNLKLLFGHILPNAAGPLLVQASLALGFATLTTAALSFIGLGAQPPSPEWGLQISDGREYILSGQWWMTTFPGIAIAMCVLGFNLLGDGLRDLFDPHSR